jgi:lipopolysaccharide transport system ATP-binding protein
MSSDALVVMTEPLSRIDAASRRSLSVPAIVARGVGKRYQIGVRKHDTLRDRLSHAGRSLLARGDGASTAGEIWALRDVSFDVAAGEAVGIIGRNGAGKSTLLKVLGRITEPTTGRVEMRGRVGSLLEVGTGFHPELTGRENIFLNGAILGEKRADIKRKFDEIVAFAEVEKFIDTPVKRYSSGMYVRLAFAVAAHLDLETLMVDEALAVGDAAFQRKCLGRMGEAAKSGRTVLFVSHSMPALEALCDRVIWINAGGVVEDGNPQRVIANYIDFSNSAESARKVGEYHWEGNRRGTGEVQFRTFRMFDSHGRETRELAMGDSLRVEVEYEAHADVDDAVFSFGLYDSVSQAVVTAWAGRRTPQRLRSGERGIWTFEMVDLPLRARKFYFSLGVTARNTNEIPYDIWDGGGTEFVVQYPENLDELDLYVGHDVALVTIPVTARFERISG